MTVAKNDLSRRHVLLAGALAATGLGTAAESGFAQAELRATPACSDEPTARQTEGPFYKPRSPERGDMIEPGSKSRPVELTGLVMTRTCRPLARAVVDLWHADENGDYDRSGFRYRGHVITAAAGSYRFRTIVPAVYPGRTRHYHVKVWVPDRPVLTTQLYFPDEPGNRRDGLFRRELVMRTAPNEGGLAARFDFVLDMR
jgi:protocatechuate 3,4-dioxygenase beta subunit